MNDPDEDEDDDEENIFSNVGLRPTRVSFVSRTEQTGPPITARVTKTFFIALYTAMSPFHSRFRITQH